MAPSFSSALLPRFAPPSGHQPGAVPRLALEAGLQVFFAACTGSRPSLCPRANPPAAGAGAAVLEVDRVRRHPGGRWLDTDRREVGFTVPLGADIAPALGRLTGLTPRTLKSPVKVAAYLGRREYHPRSDRRLARRARTRPSRSDTLKCRTSRWPLEFRKHGRRPHDSHASLQRGLDGGGCDRRRPGLTSRSRPGELVVVDDLSLDLTRRPSPAANGPTTCGSPSTTMPLGKGAVLDPRPLRASSGIILGDP